jgi:aspartyl-tRNA(Asn)/glutamyl-tRNA(Gln) amidotransferase subunit B
MKPQTIIGLEIHVQLKTKSKMFCSCDNASDEAAPNTNICPICMGHPGTLPVANKQAILYTLRIGKAIGSTFPATSKFDRKNYFYPDLPKGYQISQYDNPFCEGGSVDILVGGTTKTVRFERVHLEEDAAKSTHSPRGHSLVDYNRGGTPLAEMVTKPDMTTAEEAGAFLRELRTILRYLGVSEADMEKGNMRCDANVNVVDLESDRKTAITEIKNLNSFRSVERAIKYEEARLTEILKDGREGETHKETRGWSDKTGETTTQRSKEVASDYRYFPEPDLPPVAINATLLAAKELDMPELPAEKRRRFAEEFSLDNEAVATLCGDPDVANFYENTVSELEAWFEAQGEKVDAKRVYKLASNWILAELLKHMNFHGHSIKDLKFNPENYAEFIKIIYLGQVNSSAGQKILEKMYATGADPTEIMKNEDLAQMNNADELEAILDKVVSANPEPVSDYKAGKEKALMFLVGQVMKETKGKANPGMLKEIFERKLK